MEQLIEDVLVDLLQLLGAAALTAITYFVYHSATYKKLEKMVLAAEKQAPVLDTLVKKVQSDAEKLLTSPETEDATAKAVASALQKQGFKDITEDKVKETIEKLKEDGSTVVKEATATAAQPVTAAAAQPVTAAPAQKA